MKKILFVDDEQNILDGLRRMLYKMREEWEMTFVTSGKEALELMETGPFDAVISDMRMSEMNGAQLLRKVKELYPDTVRFILSGHSDRELVMQSLGCTHQYLAKPCDPEVLVGTIKNSLSLRHILSNKNIRGIISNMPSLPTLPKTYNKLLSALENENTSIEDLASIITEDVGMTAQVLHLVNSAFFGLTSHVDTALRAISLLGIETLKSLVLTSGIFRQFEISDLEELSLESIYNHSILIGKYAKNVAVKMQMDKKLVEEALLGGLMHDIGKAILLQYLRDKYKNTLQLAKQENVPLYRAEYEVFGVSHAEIGAYLLSLWGETDSIVEAVAFHHQPNATNTPGINALFAVHTANAIYHKQFYDDENEWRLMVLDEVYVKNIIQPDTFEEVINTCSELESQGA